MKSWFKRAIGPTLYLYISMVPSIIWVWVNTYRYIFSGMNIHLPTILMFTRGTRFWHTAICSHISMLTPEATPPSLTHRPRSCWWATHPVGRVRCFASSWTPHGTPRKFPPKTIGPGATGSGKSMDSLKSTINLLVLNVGNFREGSTG